jgi:hypothetical protein
MERVFVAFSFNLHDRPLVRDIEVVLGSFGIRPDGGEVLAGEPLDEAILKKIKASDGLIALVTRRPGDEAYSTWVWTELTAARVLSKPAVGMIEKGLKVPKGLFSQNERIELDPTEPLPAFLKLVQSVGEWKRAAGRRLRVNLLPDELAQLIRVHRDYATCDYRYVKDGEPDGDWRPATISPGVGGTLAFLRGAADELLVELRVRMPGQTWISIHSQQWTHITLEKKTGT